MTVASGSRVSIRRALLQDRPRVFEWLVHSDLTPQVFGPLFPEREPPTREQFASRYVNSCFDGTRPYSGRMFVIAAGEEEVGCIAHGPINLLKDVVELDIWLAGAQHSGRGVASQALAVLAEWLQASYGVNRFLARPSRRNVRALRALRRAGFRETDLPAQEVIATLRLPPGGYSDEVLLFRVLPEPPSTLQREDGRTYVFVDSEFTKLFQPELISLGAVATDATAFYAEVRGWSPDRTSEFVRQVVIPLLDGDAVPTDVAAEAFAAWLDERTGRAPTTIISDSGFDRWALAELLGTEDLPDGVEWKRVSIAYEDLDRAALGLNLRRHHALDDARALRHLLLSPRASAPPDEGPAR
ncbi:MAG TPA: GNAT family N-acetyltransferase [Burkholderiaceae bacterium]|nr:GNAT family N-acetyltransferase [Burkholderiaceae bacterium]